MVSCRDLPSLRLGISYKTKHYVPVDDDPAIGVAFATAAIHRHPVPTVVVTFEDFIVVYVQLPDGVWVELIEKGKRKWSIEKQRRWKNAVERLLQQDTRAAEAVLQEALVDELGRKLVIDAAYQDFTWYESRSEHTADAMEQQGDSGVETTVNQEQVDDAASRPRSTKTSVQRSAPTKQGGRKKNSSGDESGAQPKTSVRGMSQPEHTQADGPDIFLKRIRRRAGE